MRSEASTAVISSSKPTSSTTIITPSTTATATTVISHCIANQGTTQQPCSTSYQQPRHHTPTHHASACPSTHHATCIITLTLLVKHWHRCVTQQGCQDVQHN